MNTLLEIYDGREPLLNVLGAWILRPDTVICFHRGLRDENEVLGRLRDTLRQMGVKTRLRLEELDGNDGQALTRWVEAHEQELGDWAIELSGGDDVMLFMAGCCHARFGCPVYARRPGNRYYSLSDGQMLKGEKADFSVEERLSLYGGSLERYGRLTAEDLTPKMLTLAGQMLELQKKHSKLWTRQTRCLQGVCARLPDEVLTVTVSRETCRANGFSPEKGHIFRKMLRAGALREVRVTEEGLELTFPSTLVRECLCDYGVWLEMFIFGAMRSSGVFDDVRLSCVVRWEDGRAVNELDVVGTAGMGLMICSCKTCAPDMTALAELNVLGSRFGAQYAQSVIATLPKGTERLDGAIARGEELNVRVLDMRQHNQQETIAYFRRLGQRLRDMV